MDGGVTDQQLDDEARKYINDAKTILFDWFEGGRVLGILACWDIDGVIHGYVRQR